MKGKLHFILGVLLMAFIGSCTEEIDLEQPPYETQIVVDGSIETGRPARIYLTRSSPYLTHYDSASIRETFLNYARITLTSSKGEKEILTLFREDQFFPPFVYKSLGIKGETGIRYDIKVEVEGQVVEASTTIPRSPEVVDARFSARTDSSGFIEYAVQPDGEKMYLFTQVASHLAGERLHPSFNPVDVVDAGDHDPLWLQVLRSSEHRIYSLDTKPGVYSSLPRFQYSLSDTVDLAVGTVDSISHEVLRSLFSDRMNQENPFAFRGQPIESNVKGGLGRWTGIGRTDRIRVEGPGFRE